MKTKINSKSKFKSKSKSKSKYYTNICKLSSNLLKKHTTPIKYNKFTNYINSLATTFSTSHNIKPLLDTLFITKKNINFIITCKKQNIDEYNKIPPFIEIFKYLISKENFINNFTPDEQTKLKQILSLNEKVSRHTSTSTHNSIYKFLSNSYLGKKLSSLYYSLDNSIKKELEIKYPSILFHSLLINSYTSFEIIEDLDANIKTLYTFSIEWKGKKVDNLLYLFMYKNNDKYKYDIEHLHHIGNEIVKRILFFNELLEIDKLPNKFIIFLTDKTKTIDSSVISQMHFKTININSAVTNGSDIIIYRQEEVLKSIFHELIHFHNLDFRNIPAVLLNYLKKTHNIKSDNEYTLFECVTEALANILNNIFISRDIKEFTHNLENELIFSTLQVSKILSICKYKNWNEFANIDGDGENDKNSKDVAHNIKKQFKQDSCVFSYYILKFYIMLNLEYYFNNCLDTKLKFIQTEKSFKSLMSLFNTSRNNIILKDIINSMLSNVKFSNLNKLITKTKKQSTKQSNRHIINNKITNTLRMTCLETNIF